MIRILVCVAILVVQPCVWSAVKIPLLKVQFYVRILRKNSLKLMFLITISDELYSEVPESKEIQLYFVIAIIVIIKITHQRYVLIQIANTLKILRFIS